MADSENTDWEATFCSWGAAPGTTEQTKCDNAERAVRKCAIAASTKLSSKSIEVFTQGSYANRTNVRQDSDVDMCILYTDAFFPDYSMSEGLNGSVLGHSDGTYKYAEFKSDVEAALRSYFGKDSVTSRQQQAFRRCPRQYVPHRRGCGAPHLNTGASTAAPRVTGITRAHRFTPITGGKSRTGLVRTMTTASRRMRRRDADSKPSPGF